LNLSATAPEQTVKLIDLIWTLRIRGRVDEADHYYYEVPHMVQVKEGVAPEELLMMDVPQVSWLLNKPRNPEGWNTAWGRCVVGSR
jgi:hypothetical protein